jgi:Y_Y_Y domain/Histidine kinase-, DNA gyrase B-, and HSP90-like ATPase/Histidine kinase
LQAKAQQTETIHLRKYTQEQGLSSYNVRKVVQDNKGFLWIATQAGLDRFDGNNFITYKKSNPLKHGLAGIDIREVIEDSANNLLWVLPGENGVNVINTITGNVVKTIAVHQQSPDDWNLSMVMHRNSLYIGTSIGIKVYNIAKDRFEENLPLPQMAEKKPDAFEVRSIGVDKYNNLWTCFSGFGIVIYTADKKIIAQIPVNSLFDKLKGSSVWFNKLIFTANNDALLATSEGLKKISFTSKYEFQIEKQPCKAIPAINAAIVENVFESTSGEFYIAALKHFYRFDKSLSTYTLMQEPDGNGSQSEWLSDVLNIYEDKNRNIWLGCKQGLAFISNHSTAFKPYYYDPVSTEKIEHVMGVCKLSNNKIFAGLRNGLAMVDEKSGSISIIDKTHMFYHIFEDSYRRINVSREDGMFIYQNNTLVPISNIYPEFKAFSKTFINSHFFKGDSLLVLGTENNTGILVWNYIAHRLEKIDENSSKTKLASGIVNKVYQDNNKNIWVLSDNAITIISDNWTNHKIIKLYDSTRKQPTGLFFDICEAGGDYWVASYGTGIIQIGTDLKTKTIYSTNNGLSDDGVYQLYRSKNIILITTNYGLSVFNAQSKKFQNYYKNDGLHSNYFEEEAGMMKDGILYSGGVNGFTVINPELFYGNSIQPQLYIDRVVTKNAKEQIDTSNLFLQSFTIANNVLQTSVYFSALNYKNPSRTAFVYKLQEISKEWINLGTTNFVTLIGLSPGTYHLQVKAVNEDGVESESKELILIFFPKWYQTWWFYLLIALTTATILYAFYRYRITQIKKQHEIRKNIATDLHDDLGSTLNSVKVFTNLAISGVKQEESLQQVKDNLTEATISLRDMIWVLDDSLDTVDELITRLKQFAIPVAGASNIEASIKADSNVNSRQLIKEEKRNLFLICKEAINNSIKYSGASQINVTITASGKKIQIIVADNGKGFNVDEVKKGYGLKNMQYRAGQIKYKVALVSSPGNGTQVTILPS